MKIKLILIFIIILTIILNACKSENKSSNYSGIITEKDEMFSKNDQYTYIGKSPCLMVLTIYSDNLYKSTGVSKKIFDNLEVGDSVKVTPDTILKIVQQNFIKRK